MHVALVGSAISTQPWQTRNNMTQTLLFNKPFQVLSQFSPSADKSTLADYIDVAGVYAAGRLDFDSEGLMVLTDDGALQARISNPRYRQTKTYLAQVEGIPDDGGAAGAVLGCKTKGWSHPVRQKYCLSTNPPGSGIAIHRSACAKISRPSGCNLRSQEGRNRQVRRMTAAVGHPTLRLVRTGIGDWALDGLLPGEYRMLR